ncbi:unnamed protein product, partial [Owenia fusiformis]
QHHIYEDLVDTKEHRKIISRNVVNPPYDIYVGEDKYENEDLLKWAFPEDVWFHVDKLSSAHVYLRLHTGETLDDVPHSVIEDCAQLVKANSIAGNKQNNVNVVYTMFENLKKTAGMDVGQVGFHKQKQVRSILVEKRLNEIVNRLNKTKEERHPNLQELREERDKAERDDKKAVLREQKKQEKEEAEKREKEAELRSYDRLMTSDRMTTNQNNTDLEDDFM